MVIVQHDCKILPLIQPLKRPTFTNGLTQKMILNSTVTYRVNDEDDVENLYMCPNWDFSQMPLHYFYTKCSIGCNFRWAFLSPSLKVRLDTLGNMGTGSGCLAVKGTSVQSQSQACAFVNSGCQCVHASDIKPTGKCFPVLIRKFEDIFRTSCACM